MGHQCDSMLWNEFAKSISWGSVLEEYLEALRHLEAYKAAHPGRELPAPVVRAIASVRAVYDGLRHVVDNPACYGQPASPEAVNLILATVRRVMIDVPFAEPLGHA